MAAAKKGASLDWRSVFSWKKILITITILVIITFFAYYFGFLKKTCATPECFEESLQKCTPTKYLKLQNLNYYKYSIMGWRGDSCKIDVQLMKMAEGTAFDKKALFEGKAMTCRIPMDNLEMVKSDNIEGILNYCTGPLKEAMYELIIQKLYTIVIANLGDVIGEIQSTIKGEI